MSDKRVIHPPHRAGGPFYISVLLLFIGLARAQPVAAQTAVPATAVPLILPSAIVFDAQGNLYLAETGRHVIRKVDINGDITTVVGTGDQGTGGDAGRGIAAQLDSPQGLALDSGNGNLYIADTHNHCIRKLNFATGLISTIVGVVAAPGFDGDSGPAIAAHMNLPSSLALDIAGNLYIADTGNHRIRRIDAVTGIITTVAGNGVQGFAGDDGLAVAASIDSPTGIAVDSSGNLYLADTHNHRIRKITTVTGQIATIAGSGVTGFSGEGVGATIASLALPRGLSLDAAGNLYLADTGNHRVRRIDAATGTITTVAGDGTQDFAGDDVPAIAASLDSPRSTTISPAGFATMTDTGNQRIRQLGGLPGPTTSIHTIAGIGLPSAGALTLSAPGTIVYGTGQLVASLAAASQVTGQVSFFDISNGVPSALGTASLVESIAIFSTVTLPAGLHNIVAIYGGDSTHASAQSATLALSIAPQQITATLAPITLLYGQPFPSFNGSLAGLLLQDAHNLTVAFTTTAISLSPVGTYPIAAVLSGLAAGNYTVANAIPLLRIDPAPTLVAFSSQITSATTFAAGSSITLPAHVSSTTTGVPTGTATLLDGAAPVLTSPLSSSGDASFTLASLSQGFHTLTVAYSGDHNFTSSTSGPKVISVGTAPPSGEDFTLTTTGAISQTIPSGNVANFTFAVQTQGSLASPIALAASGLPNFATASFNPSYLPPGGAANTFTLTIATAKTIASQHTWPGSSEALAFLFPIVGLAFYRRRSRRLASLLLFAVAALCLPLLSGCGDRTNIGAPSANTSQSYAITVTGTATSSTGAILQHAATVTLLVNSPS